MTRVQMEQGDPRDGKILGKLRIENKLWDGIKKRP